MSEPISKHAALVAEFEAIEDGEAFVAKINEVAPLWPELRGAVADIGAGKFEDWHGIVEAWDRAAAKPKVLAEQKVIEPEPEAVGAAIRRRLLGGRAKADEEPMRPELAALIKLVSVPLERPEPSPIVEDEPASFFGAEVQPGAEVEPQDEPENEVEEAVGGFRGYAATA